MHKVNIVEVALLVLTLCKIDIDGLTQDPVWHHACRRKATFPAVTDVQVSIWSSASPVLTLSDY